MASSGKRQARIAESPPSQVSINCKGEKSLSGAILTASLTESLTSPRKPLAQLQSNAVLWEREALHASLPELPQLWERIAKVSIVSCCRAYLLPGRQASADHGSKVSARERLPDLGFEQEAAQMLDTPVARPTSIFQGAARSNSRCRNFCADTPAMEAVYI